MLPYPKFDPVLISIGPLSIRWYGIAYIAGAILGMRWVFTDLKKIGVSQDQALNWMSWLMIGVVLGGRLGYILFYGGNYYLQNPTEILAVWRGGMSYHGGAIGAMFATILFAKCHTKPHWALLDQLGIGSTFGIFFGRIANFINGELVGRVTTVPWAMIFPHEGGLPRHPSQLYEAFCEGMGVLLILTVLKKTNKLNHGQLFGAYLIGYGICRCILEYFRQPDPQVGFIIGTITMGQALSGIMILLGAGIILYRRGRREFII